MYCDCRFVIAFTASWLIFLALCLVGLLSMVVDCCDRFGGDEANYRRRFPRSDRNQNVSKLRNCKEDKTVLKNRGTFKNL